MDEVNKLIVDCEPNKRLLNVLKFLKVKTLGDLSKMSAKELMRLKNFDKKTLRHVNELLAEEGLSLYKPPKTNYRQGY